MAKKKYEYGPEIRVTVNQKVIDELTNISEHLGHRTLSSFLRPKLREIRDSYPEKMRIKPEDI